MNKSADESGNGLQDWALMIPVVVVGAVCAVVYGVACMVMWAASTVGEGVKRVRPER